MLALIALATAGGCGSDSGDSGDSGDSAKEGSSGIESKSPQQILEESAAALARVKSFHVEGHEGAGSKKTSIAGDVGLPESLDLSITQGGSSATLRAVDGSLYIRANEAFWREQKTGSAAGELADRWFKAPTSSRELRDLTKDLDPAKLSRCLLKDHGTIADGGKATVDGQEAVVIVDKGDRPGTAPGKLFVAATGEPLPLRTLTTGKERPGGTKDPECDSDDSPAQPGDTATFSNYNEPLNISAPPSAVDLGGKGSAS